MKNRYLILIIIYLAGIAAPLNQFKVPPLMHLLTAELNIDFAASGWLMSAFAFIGFVFALPAGMIVRRIGLKNAGIIALSTLPAGSLSGTFATTAWMILLSRFIEGAGLCLMSIVGPSAIAAWFPPEKRGAPMGLWATWVPAGTLIMFALGPFASNWHALWVGTSIYTALILALFCLFFKLPERNSAVVIPHKTDFSAYKNLNIWLLGAAFMSFNMMSISMKTYVPKFLREVQGFSDIAASAQTNLIMIFSIIAAPLTGMLSDIVKSRKAFIVTGMLVAAGITASFFTMDGHYSQALILLGAIMGIIPAAVFSLTPELMKSPEQAGTSMSIITLGQNTGMFAGPVLFSMTAGHYSWQTAGYTFAIVLAFGCLISISIKTK